MYALVALSALVGICSLGADYGRVQLAKYELQRAADAAARAAALSLSQGNDAAAARAAAIAVAAQNTVDGTPLVLVTADVQIGNWNNGVFVVGQSPSNATRVLARRTSTTGNAIPLMLGSLLGMRTCDVSASATSLGRAGSTAGIVGIQNVTVRNNATFASYNSGAGQPGGANITNSGDVGSNGTVTLGQNGDVRGDVVLGPSGSISTGNNFYTTGSTLQQASALSYPATETPTGTNLGNVSIGNNGTYNLAGGTYIVNNITTGNNVTINCTGPATVYVNGDISAGNSLTINAYQGNPANLILKIYGTGRTITTGNSFTLTGQLYGPGCDLDLFNGATLAGSVVARSISANNNAEFYYDTRLPIPQASSGGGSVGVSLVK